MITTAQKVDLTVSPLTSNGMAGSIVGTPLWSSSSVSNVSLIVAADGMSAYAIAGTVGSSTVSVIANAGTLAVPVQITGSIVIQVVPAAATTLSILASTPVSQ